MIYNIVDRRDRIYRWRTVNAIVEATSHDNSVADSDQIAARDGDVTYDEREGISLAEAVTWAQALPGPVTLYLYNEGEGTTASKR